MTISISDELEQALNAEESGELGKIIQSRRPEHFENLLKLVTTDSDINAKRRIKAIYALGRWGNLSVISDIERVLPQLDEAGRIAAVDALGRLGTKQALEVVSRYTDDPSSQVRKFVIYALRKIGDLEAQTRLRQIANQDSENWLRELASKQIERLSEKSRVI